jgi:hypothetical protein
MSDLLIFPFNQPPIPGLLRDGSPVILHPSIREHYGGKSSGIVFAAGNVAALVTFLEDCRPLPFPLEDLRLDWLSPTGRFHARLWLEEQGYPTTEDRAEVLAWSVVSVSRGGKPLIGTAWAPDPGALARGWALFDPEDFSLTLPSLPEVPHVAR